MNDLISRKHLLRWLRDYQFENYAEIGHEKEYNFIENLIKGIENDPSVEPVRGKWLYDGFNGEWLCSNCKSQIALSDDRNAHPNFCPQCGADMRGEKND